MKYLVVGPAAMGYFSFLGFLKRNEEKLKDIKEYSGSSAGAMLCLFLALNISVDEIIEFSFNINLKEYTEYDIFNLINNYGLIKHEKIKTIIKNFLKKDYTFNEIDKKIYISAFCLSTSKTIYFSKDTHPDMSVIDAVCASISIPYIFETFKIKNEYFVDGGTVETVPYYPFLNKKPDKVHVLKIKKNTQITSNINNIVEYTKVLLYSTLNNRHDCPNYTKIHELDVEDINIFDFNMNLETKIKLFFIGFN